MPNNENTRHAADFGEYQHDGRHDAALVGASYEDSSTEPAEQCEPQTLGDLEEAVTDAAFDFAATVADAGMVEEIVAAASDLAGVVNQYNDAVEDLSERVERSSRAIRVLFAFKEFVKDNPQTMHAWEALALDAASHGRRFGARQLIEYVRDRRHNFADVHGGAVKIDNSFAPLLGRYLVAKYPHLGPLIEMRASVFDVYAPEQLLTILEG